MRLKGESKKEQRLQIRLIPDIKQSKNLDLLKSMRIKPKNIYNNNVAMKMSNHNNNNNNKKIIYLFSINEQKAGNNNHNEADVDVDSW